MLKQHLLNYHCYHWLLSAMSADLQCQISFCKSCLYPGIYISPLVQAINKDACALKTGIRVTIIQKSGNWRKKVEGNYPHPLSFSFVFSLPDKIKQVLKINS